MIDKVKGGSRNEKQFIPLTPSDNSRPICHKVKIKVKETEE